MPLIKTAGVVENSGHCVCSIGLKCFLNCLSLFHLVFYIYIYKYIHTLPKNYLFNVIYIYIYIFFYVNKPRVFKESMFVVLSYSSHLCHLTFF